MVVMQFGLDYNAFLSILLATLVGHVRGEAGAMLARCGQDKALQCILMLSGMRGVHEYLSSKVPFFMLHC